MFCVTSLCLHTQGLKQVQVPTTQSLAEVKTYASLF